MTKPNIPQYLRIKNHILTAIRNRELVPGNKIAPELELARQFGVSRMTVNKAMRDLAEAGVVRRFAGDGTYVAERKAESPLLYANNIADEIQLRGNIHCARVVRLCALPASEEVALYMGVRTGYEMFHSLIVHHENGCPIQLEERFVNPAWIPAYLQQDFTRMTPNEYLLGQSPLTSIEHTVEAVLPSPKEQDFLSIEAYEPCILVLRRTWSDKHLISFARLLHPGSRYKLRSQTNINK